MRWHTRAPLTPSQGVERVQAMLMNGDDTMASKMYALHRAVSYVEVEDDTIDPFTHMESIRASAAMHKKVDKYTAAVLKLIEETERVTHRMAVRNATHE